MSGVVIVTGGGRGIGAACARLAGQRGHAVYVNDNASAAQTETTVEKFAATALWLISAEASYITATAIEVTGGR